MLETPKERLTRYAPGCIVLPEGVMVPVHYLTNISMVLVSDYQRFCTIFSDVPSARFCTSEALRMAYIQLLLFSAQASTVAIERMRQSANRKL